ncbi:hypothetical protein FBU30_006852 [Linnemannia zychae]|nr:hypothetical protein FBU30_006852 [Linnemannia zychae]
MDTHALKSGTTWREGEVFYKAIAHQQLTEFYCNLYNPDPSYLDATGPLIDTLPPGTTLAEGDDASILINALSIKPKDLTRYFPGCTTVDQATMYINDLSDLVCKDNKARLHALIPEVALEKVVKDPAKSHKAVNLVHVLGPPKHQTEVKNPILTFEPDTFYRRLFERPATIVGWGSYGWEGLVEEHTEIDDHMEALYKNDSR